MLRTQHGESFLTSTIWRFLNRDGMTAPMVLGGPMNGAAVPAYVKQVLILELELGDIMVVDNLPVHHCAVVRAAIESANAVPLYVPPYNPDFHTIANAFAKLKACLPKVAVRTIDAL